MANRTFWKPLVMLLLLPPLIGEALTGSTPLVGFLNPVAALMLIVLYGGGALLVREMRVRWGKDWRAAFVLGAAYGVWEEGLLCKSFFDPHWKNLGTLDHYGRLWQVNWIWALMLIIFHACISIATPILLTELAHKPVRNRVWLSDRALRNLAVVFVINLVVGYLGISKYRPPVPQYLLAVLVTAMLVWWARNLPGKPFKPAPSPAVGMARFFVAGTLGVFALFFMGWGAPELGLPVVLCGAGLCAITWAYAWMLQRMTANGEGWVDRQRLMLLTGVLFLFISFATVKQPIVALGFTSFMVWMWRRELAA